MNSTNSSDRADQRASMGEAAAYAALGQIILSNRPLEQALTEVTALVQRALPERPEVSVTLLSEDHPRTAASSGDVAVLLDQRQYEDGDGPCLDAAVSGGPIRVAMDDPDAPYRSSRQSARRAGVTHSLSVRIPAAGPVTGAALNLYTSTNHPFTADSARIAGTVAGVAGFALASVDRDGGTEVAVQLQQAMASRALISRAQGLLMAQLHCSREVAFARLMSLAEDRGVRLHQAAQTILDETAGPTAGS